MGAITILFDITVQFCLTVLSPSSALERVTPEQSIPATPPVFDELSVCTELLGRTSYPPLTSPPSQTHNSNSNKLLNYVFVLLDTASISPVRLPPVKGALLPPVPRHQSYLITPALPLPSLHPLHRQKERPLPAHPIRTNPRRQHNRDILPPRPRHQPINPHHARIARLPPNRQPVRCRWQVNIPCDIVHIRNRNPRQRRRHAVLWLLAARVGRLGWVSGGRGLLVEVGDLVGRESHVVQAEVSHRAGEVLIGDEERAADVVVEGAALGDEAGGRDGGGVGAAGDVLAVVVQAEAAAVGGFDGEGDGLPGIAGQGAVGPHFGFEVPVCWGHADAELGIARGEDVAVAVAGGRGGVADAEDEPLAGLLCADVDFDGHGEGAEVAQQVGGELDVVVDAIETRAVVALELDAVDVGAVEVVPAPVGGSRAGGVVEGEVHEESALCRRHEGGDGGEEG